MRTGLITALAFTLIVSAMGAQEGISIDTRGLSTVAPALENYTEEDLFGRVWENDELSIHDRILVTIAAMIARSQTEELPDYIRIALDNGVSPAEVSETITHLAFYAGQPNVFSALPVAAEVFKNRKQ